MRNAVVTTIRFAVEARDRSLPHLERKIYHCVMGLICLSLYAFVMERHQALLLLSSIGGAWVLLDIVRCRVPAMNDLALRLFGKLMRREELKSISGNSFYVLGLITVVLFFPKPVVLLSVLYLALGDPSAAIVGTLIGKHKIFGKKSVEGALANYTICCLGTVVFAVTYFQLPIERALSLGLIGGAVSMVSELIPSPLDDNFTIPVASAVLLSLVRLIVPIF